MTKQQSKKPIPLTKVRHIIQNIIVLGTFLIGVRHIMPGREATGGSFDAFCPMGGIETLIPYILHGHTLKTTNLLNFALLLGILGVALLSGRAFCGWMCPLGTLQDMFAGWARHLSGEKHHIRGKRSKARFPIVLPPKVDKWARYIKYFVLAGVLLASAVTIYPPLHAFCPVRAVFSFQMTGLLVSVLITFVITSLLVKRFWCKYLCPLGAALAIFNKIAPLRVKINDNHCPHCGRCDAECPMDITPIPESMRSLECIQCLECVETCTVPDAVELKLG
jgi:polyferredoxin